MSEPNFMGARLPERPLNDQSLHVEPQANKKFLEWDDEDHSNSFEMMQKIIALWKKNGIASQYLVYGKEQRSNNSFKWEIVPHYQPSNILSRFWQQLLILYKISFGAPARTPASEERQYENYKRMFAQPYIPRLEQPDTICWGKDPFCTHDVLIKQYVIAGDMVNVLFSYTPIGFGGEKLHFLIIPKNHRRTFAELTQPEYQESMQLTKRIITHFSTTRNIQSAYLFHKSGRDAGQTVPHWHMHVVLTSNKTQDFFGKLTVLKNMLIGSSPMRDPELSLRVTQFRIELKPKKTSKVYSFDRYKVG